MPAMRLTCDLHHVVHGEGTDLVVLHPVGLDHTFMRSLAAAAETQGCRVINIDLRGHGRSPAAGEGPSLEDYVADIHQVVATRCERPAIVLGLSFGGMLAQRYALTHARHVAGLVLCGCTAGFSAEVRPLLRERGDAALRGGMAAVVEPTIERWFTAAFRADPRVQEVRARLLADDASNWHAAWQAISHFDALPRLKEIAVPTLVVAGDCDAATPLAAAASLAAAIPNARLATVAGAPHMMQIESADAFNATVSEFLAAWPRC
jgi:3-oxoadipate enol-lactonase